MAKWIRKPEHVRVERYDLVFDSKEEPGAGFSFPCDAHGKVLFDQIADNNHILWTLTQCLTGAYAVKPGEVRDHSYTYHDPGSIECLRCGHEVHMDAFTNSCSCGANYNPFGQLLAERTDWGS
jgi:hypothetical protein